MCPALAARKHNAAHAGSACCREPPVPACCCAGVLAATAARNRFQLWGPVYAVRRTHTRGAPTMTRGRAEYSFYSYERTAVVLAVCYALYIYGPPPVPRLDPAVKGVVANFSDGVAINGVKQPFFFGLATAAAHVEDQARSLGSFTHLASPPRTWLMFQLRGRCHACSLRTTGWSSPKRARCPPT